jgi:hypothetical protein
MARAWRRRACGLLLLALAACAGPGEEARVRTSVAAVVRAAEKRDANEVMSRVATDYADFEGRDKAAAERLVRSYFERYRGIVIHGLGSEVEIQPSGGEAAVRLDVVMTHAAAEVFKRLAATSIALYRFRLELRKEEDRWLVAYAEWESIGLADLLPGSAKPLNKLYPTER